MLNQDLKAHNVNPMSKFIHIVPQKKVHYEWANRSYFFPFGGIDSQFLPYTLAKSDIYLTNPLVFQSNLCNSNIKPYFPNLMLPGLVNKKFKQSQSININLLNQQNNLNINVNEENKHHDNIYKTLTSQKNNDQSQSKISIKEDLYSTFLQDILTKIANTEANTSNEYSSNSSNDSNIVNNSENANPIYNIEYLSPRRQPDLISSSIQLDKKTPINNTIVCTNNPIDEDHIKSTNVIKGYIKAIFRYGLYELNKDKDINPSKFHLFREFFEKYYEHVSNISNLQWIWTLYDHEDDNIKNSKKLLRSFSKKFLEDDKAIEKWIQGSKIKSSNKKAYVNKRYIFIKGLENPETLSNITNI